MEPEACINEHLDPRGSRDEMIAAAGFVEASFGPEAELDIEDDGSAFITTPHATVEGYFAFDHEGVSCLTLVP